MERFGLRCSFVLGAALQAVFATAQVASEHLWQLVALQAALGACHGFAGTVGFIAFCNAWFGDRPSTAIAIQFSAFGLAAWSKCPNWQRPSSAPVPPRGAPGGPGQLGPPRARPGPVSPLPRLLGRAASKAAGSPAFDHPGLAGVLWTPTAALLADRYGWRWALGAVAAMQWCSTLALSPPY